MDLLKLHRRATESADKFIKNIQDSQWELPTPCTDWNLKALVNHLVYENLWVPELLIGKTVEEVGSRFDGDVVGDDPIDAWDKTSHKALDAVEQITDINQIIHLSYSDVPVSEYLNQRILDLLIHGWDVAKAINQDTILDEVLIEHVYAYVSPRQKELMESGVFGKPVSVSDDAPLQTKLLAMLGRVA